ncbi:MAG: HesB/IscA family protein [Pseudomonadales bacterium]
MSVETFDPAATASSAVKISLSDAASAHIESQIAKVGERHIRLGVEESGCNGYKYTLDFITQPDADEQAFKGGAHWQLYVRNKDLPFVDGTEVDLEVDGLNRALKFKNPNAASECGCGESFSVG